MALVSCPDCGAQVSDTAIVCVQCGFPLRCDALAASTGRGGGSSPRNTAGIIMAVVVAGFFGIVVIGILAALAIPRFAGAAGRMKEMEGELLLKQAYMLENRYFSEHGEYAPSLEALKSVGWRQTRPPNFYTIEVASADSSDVCLQALPLPSADVQPMRMRTNGLV